MKKILLLIGAVLLYLPLSFGQNTLNLTDEKINQYISDVYGSAFVNDNPTLVTAFAELLNGRISFKIEEVDSTEKYLKLSSLGLNNKLNPAITAFDYSFDIETFNPLCYHFDFFSNQVQIIRIDGTDKLMIIEASK